MTMSFKPMVLGRTGLKVGRFGLSAAYGTPARAVEEAFEHGVNYFYTMISRTRFRLLWRESTVFRCHFIAFIVGILYMWFALG